MDTIIVDGVSEEIPVNDLCWVCGTSCEVWPLMSKADVLEKLADPKFKMEFATVRTGVSQAQLKLFRQQDVLSTQGVGLKVIFRCAFVTSDVFAVHMKIPLSASNAKEVKLNSPDNGELAGCLMNWDDIPERGLPHYIVEFYSFNRRSIDEFLLRKEDIQRRGHTKDMHVHSVKRFLPQRGGIVSSTSSCANLPTYKRLKDEAKSLEQNRPTAEATKQKELEGLDTERQVTVRKTRGSRLEAESGSESQGQSKKKRRGGGGTPSKVATQRRSDAAPGLGAARGGRGPGIPAPRMITTGCSTVGGAASDAGDRAAAQQGGGSGSVLAALAFDEAKQIDDNNENFDLHRILHGFCPGRSLKPVQW